MELICVWDGGAHLPSAFNVIVTVNAMKMRKRESNKKTNTHRPKITIAMIQPLGFAQRWRGTEFATTHTQCVCGDSVNSEVISQHEYWKWRRTKKKKKHTNLQQLNMGTRANLMKQHDQNVGSQCMIRRGFDSSSCRFARRATLLHSHFSHNQTNERGSTRSFYFFAVSISVLLSFSLFLTWFKPTKKKTNRYNVQNRYTFNRLRWRIPNKREEYIDTYSIRRRHRIRATLNDARSAHTTNKITVGTTQYAIVNIVLCRGKRFRCGSLISYWKVFDINATATKTTTIIKPKRRIHRQWQLWHEK